MNPDANEQGNQHNSREMLDAEARSVLLSRMTNLLLPLATPQPHSQT